MASSDLAELRSLIHEEGWALDGYSIHVQNPREIGTATVTLRRGDETKAWTSGAEDVILYLFHNHNFHAPSGDVRMAPVRDLNQYWDDVRHLVDEDRAKLQGAMRDLAEKKFQFSYAPEELIDASLFDQRPHAKKYEPLKRDHHHIVAYHLMVSRNLLAARENLVAQKRGVQKYIAAADELTISFRPSTNAVENYTLYRRYAAFDFAAYVRRVENQKASADETIRELVEADSPHARTAIPKLLRVYKTLLELANPILNILRAGAELSQGSNAPDAVKGLTENVAVLRAHPRVGHAFKVLDVRLRNAEAHASWEIHDRELHVYDHRGKKTNLIGTYTYAELAGLVHEAHQMFFPAVLNVFALQEVVMRDLVVLSREHKLYLTTVGNAK